jgi:hypothetical protein
VDIILREALADLREAGAEEDLQEVVAAAEVEEEEGDRI